MDTRIKQLGLKFIHSKVPSSVQIKHWINLSSVHSTFSAWKLRYKFDLLISICLDPIKGPNDPGERFIVRQILKKLRQHKLINK